MLRNIPNRVDVEQFITMLNEYAAGEYDFTYLRIDFHTNNNVGYAFINFISDAGLLSFLYGVDGRQWARWNSNKVARVSYATIQGRDSLIQKFRNSSVMFEREEFRPQVSHFLMASDEMANVVAAVVLP